MIQNLLNAFVQRISWGDSSLGPTTTAASDDVTALEADNERRILMDEQDDSIMQSLIDGISRLSVKESDLNQVTRLPPSDEIIRNGQAILSGSWSYSHYSANQPLPYGYQQAELTITALQTLQTGEWLDDEVINAWLELIKERNESAIKRWEDLNKQEENYYRNGLTKAVDIDSTVQKYVETEGGVGTLSKGLASKSSTSPPSVCTFTTFFWSKLTARGEYNFNAVNRWTKRKKIDIFAYDFLLIPVHVTGSHWALGVVQMQWRTCYFLDSLTNKNCEHGSTFASTVTRWVNDEHQDKHGRPLPSLINENNRIPDWSLVYSPFAAKSKRTKEVRQGTLWSPPEVPQQSNGNDCGVFTCWHAECVSDGRWPTVIDFDADDVKTLRPLMASYLTQKYLPGYCWKTESN
eukprot:GHVH01010008.1.p1 GENE.GHVH01010008.1~~GHVH01010008.1.p1  ORF type:complete len:406 (-),score=47.95 GHVH01010008.1:1915-3132(-)